MLSDAVKEFLRGVIENPKSSFEDRADACKDLSEGSDSHSDMVLIDRYQNVIFMEPGRTVKVPEEHADFFMGGDITAEEINRMINRMRMGLAAILILVVGFSLGVYSYHAKMHGYWPFDEQVSK